MKDKKLIFVSNDDGIDAPGLKKLIDMVRPYGEVFVVAPEHGQSGMSHSISLLKPLRTKTYLKEDGLTIIAVPGTPVDCVKLALNQLLPKKPDIMVSGINHGSNSAISVIYSGTMGAAIESGFYGIPSIGFSLLDYSKDADFDLAVKYSEKIFLHILENGLPEFVSLNVNFPAIKEKDFKGIKVCKQTQGVWKEEFEKRKDPYGFDYYWLTGEFHNFQPEDTETDEYALKNNYAAIVPVKIDFTDYSCLEKLKKIF